LRVLLFCVALAFIPNGAAQWVQQGGKLVGTGYVQLNPHDPIGYFAPLQGTSVALSADGNTRQRPPAGSATEITASCSGVDTNGANFTMQFVVYAYS